MDNVPVPKTTNLSQVPREILEQGSQHVAMFLLDLFGSPTGRALYRSKIMVVGFENVGKTTLITSLFPLTGKLKNQGVEYHCKLQGKYLTRSKIGGDKNHKDKSLTLESHQWSVSPCEPNGITLSPRAPEGKPIQLFAETKKERELWLERLKQTCLNTATHAIDITHLKLNPSEFSVQDSECLELSVWDFAGQREYYHNHQYFLSTRSVFLVVWKISEGTEGLKSLDFWLRSLACHLPQNDFAHKEISFSVIIVGTFLDEADKCDIQPGDREKRARELAEKCGIQPESTLYFEVSSSTLEDIDQLKASIYRVLKTHSYMGERVPNNYLAIKDFLEECRGARDRTLPLVNLDVITQKVGDESLAKRALKLLSLWGECVYFDDTPELASTVIIDPRFLAKNVLGQLFNPNLSYKDGVVKHSDLPQIWNSVGTEGNFESLAVKLISLMTKFEACFVLEEPDKSFMEKSSLIPWMLPEKNAKHTSPLLKRKAEDWDLVWPKDPPFDRPLQLERTIQFNLVPGELVSRLMVRLHSMILDGMIWRNDVIIFNPQTNSQAWIQVNQEKSRFIVTLRGSVRTSCCQLMDKILEEVKESLLRFPSVTMKEQIRSPHDREAFIDLEEVQKDAQRSFEDRTLQCPSTGLPIKAEVLLVSTGIIDHEISPRGEIFSTSFIRFSLRHEKQLFSSFPSFPSFFSLSVCKSSSSAMGFLFCRKDYGTSV